MHRSDRIATAIVTLIAIAITCVLANNAPNINYSHNMRILKLPRKLPPGTLIYRIKGSDPDPDVLQFGVKGRDANHLLEVKGVSFTEADVYLKSQLKVSRILH